MKPPALYPVFGSLASASAQLAMRQAGARRSSCSFSFNDGLR